MAEENGEATPDASELNENYGYPEPSEVPKLAEDENATGSSSQFTSDLKSVLVTSVLNLEKLDVDLYR